MLLGERELRAEISGNKAQFDSLYARLLASVVGGVPEWSGPIVNGAVPTPDGDFFFTAGDEIEAVTFTVNPLVYVATAATGHPLVGEDEAGALTLAAETGNLAVIFVPPLVMTDGVTEFTIPAGEFITLGGKENEAMVISLSCVQTV